MPLTLDALGVTASLNREPKKLFRCRFLQGILYCLEGCELNGPGLAIQLFDFADIDVLHNVTSARVNRDRSARTFPFHALHGCNYRISASLAAGLFQRLEDQTDTIVAADRNEVCTVTGCLCIGVNIVLVGPGGVRRGIKTSSYNAQKRVTCPRQIVVVDDVTCADELDA